MKLFKMNVDKLVDDLPEDIQKYLTEFGIIKISNSVYNKEDGLYKKKYEYKFINKIDLDKDIEIENNLFKFNRHFMKTYDELYTNSNTGTIRIIKKFTPRIRTSPWGETRNVYKSLEVIYKNDFIYYEYRKDNIDRLNVHIVRVYNNGDIWFTYSPKKFKRQTIIRNKLYAESKYNRFDIQNNRYYNK